MRLPGVLTLLDRDLGSVAPARWVKLSVPLLQSECRTDLPPIQSPARRVWLSAATGTLLVFGMLVLVLCAAVPWLEAVMRTRRGISIFGVGSAWEYEPCARATLLLALADAQVACGETIAMASVEHIPRFAFAGAAERALYALVVSRPDESRWEYRQWVLGNIPGNALRSGNISEWASEDSDTLQVLASWISPRSLSSAVGRYDFLLFSEYGPAVTFEPLPPERVRWSTREWADSYGLGPPVASTSFYVHA